MSVGPLGGDGCGSSWDIMDSGPSTADTSSGGTGGGNADAADAADARSTSEHSLGSNGNGGLLKMSLPYQSISAQPVLK